DSEEVYSNQQRHHAGDQERNAELRQAEGTTDIIAEGEGINGHGQDVDENQPPGENASKMRITLRFEKSDRHAFPLNLESEGEITADSDQGEDAAKEQTDPSQGPGDA